MKKILNLLAFDLGASNGRAILGRFDGEKVEMKELHRFENNYIEVGGVYVDLAALFASENPIFQSKKSFLADFAPGNSEGILAKRGLKPFGFQSRFATAFDKSQIWQTHLA